MSMSFRGRLLASGLVSAVLASVIITAPAVAALPTACRVRNLESGAVASSLQRAVRTAMAGDRLRVKGTCLGNTVIGKKIRVFGYRTRVSGLPALVSTAARGSEGPVLLVRPGVSVTIRGLTIRGGRPCCGIINRGSLRLRDVDVRGNSFMAGGGLSIERGTVYLDGSTVIRRNEAGWGGGGVLVASGARLVMNDSSSIRANIVSVNPEAHGGGVLLDVGATLTMNGASAIRANASAAEGGGLAWHQGAIRNGVVCGPGAGANVVDNTPDDCFEIPA